MGGDYLPPKNDYGIAFIESLIVKFIVSKVKESFLKDFLLILIFHIYLREKEKKSQSFPTIK